MSRHDGTNITTSLPSAGLLAALRAALVVIRAVGALLNIIDLPAE